MTLPAADKMRSPRVAGLFYSNREDELRHQIEEFFRTAPLETGLGKTLGLVAPHAGYMYSGHTAARAYKQLAGHAAATVVVVAPSHREYFEGVSVYPGKGYATPLDGVETDRDAADFILEREEVIHATSAGHGEEHALEVQIPFLQMILGGFKLVPLVMGEQSGETILALARALAELQASRDILLVASSDLSHFHSQSRARQLDEHVLQSVEQLDDEALWRDILGHRCEACGAGPILAVMKATKLGGADRGRVLGYSTSGDVTGETDRVVGYMAAVFAKSAGE